MCRYRPKPASTIIWPVNILQSRCHSDGTQCRMPSVFREIFILLSCCSTLIHRQEYTICNPYNETIRNFFNTTISQSEDCLKCQKHCPSGTADNGNVGCLGSRRARENSQRRHLLWYLKSYLPTHSAICKKGYRIFVQYCRCNPHLCAETKYL